MNKVQTVFFITGMLVVLNFQKVSSQVKPMGSNNEFNTALERDFLHPPDVFRPYVWWHWLGSNFSKEGITKDLEAMKASGIGGATIFNISSSVVESHLPTLNNPWPDQTYRSPKYWEAVRHAATEAKRLGIELGLHNTVGYSTTGGPWIDEPRSMQQLVWSESSLVGGKILSVSLPIPVFTADEGWGKTGRSISWFKDFAVLAIPAHKNQIKLSEIIDLSAKMDTNGHLNWIAPEGNWKVYRLAHASTGRPPHPVPDDVLGKVLEADKMSLEQTNYHWNQVIEPIKKNLGSLVGTGLKHFLIDSYEAGNQNWSPNFREDFKKIKGYDPLPWLMTFNATVYNGKKPPAAKDSLDPVQRVIESKELSARFEWDYKDVISQLFYQNGWKPAADLIHQAGMIVQQESYGGPFNTVQGSALADIPMWEFWSGRKTNGSPVVMGAARAAGKKIIGAEALTGGPKDSKWTEVPSFLKPTLDAAYANGVNRMVLHHWVHQPFDNKYQPGFGMGWWGTHFSRYQTWFEPGKEFFLYMARVQSMLQKGETTIDVLSLGGDSPITDIVSTDVFLKDVRVKNGKIILPSGRSYFVLYVPHTGKLLPVVVLKIQKLLDEGAIVVASKPTASPSLSNYPDCDKQLMEMATLIWGNNETGFRKIGKGKLYTDGSILGLKKTLNELGCVEQVKLIEEDPSIQIMQRTNQQSSWFFIANTGDVDKKITASFAVTNQIPELWDAETGAISKAVIWRNANGRIEVELSLLKHKSILVVFRKNTAPLMDQLVRIDAPSGYELTVNKKGTPILESSIPMKGLMHFKSGKSKQFELGLSDTIPLKGVWKVSFHPPVGKEFSSEFSKLVSFANNADANIKYFSGTATYQLSFQLNKSSFKKDQRFKLDLGKVFDLATVKVNGVRFAVFWNPPFVGDISDLLKEGTNTIEVAVANAWHNLLVGDEQYPADFEWGVDRGENGRMMKGYPDWFIKNQPRPEKNRKGFVVWYYHKKDTPLLPAGLVGPVNLIAKAATNASIE